MIKRFALTCGIAASILLTGCYNNPETSLRKPGEGPVDLASGPAVGPGTVAGGSTAGPQPPPATHGKEAEHGKPAGHSSEAESKHGEAKAPAAGHAAPPEPGHAPKH